MIIKNRKAYHDYEIIQKFEAGMVLEGCEVKSLRKGSCSLQGAYAEYKRGHVLLQNMLIGAFQNIKIDEKRSRILLLKKREINKIMSFTEQKGHACIPLEINWNEKGKAKIIIACAVGKKLYDKRRALKEKEIKRETSNLSNYTTTF